MTWALHIISDQLLVLAANRSLPQEMCRAIRDELKPQLEPLGITLIVMWDLVAVLDHRPETPELTAAFRTVEDWMTTHA